MRFASQVPLSWSLEPVSQQPANRFWVNHKAHAFIKDQAEVAEKQAAKQGVAIEEEEEMVMRRKLTANQFLSNTRTSTQSQQARLADHIPPPPPPSCRQKKKQRLDDPLVRMTSEAPTKTPPRPVSGIVIRDPAGGTQPITPSGAEVASSSQAAPTW
nr:hypothetical protein CFP56_18786 [Quercus suber]